MADGNGHIHLLDHQSKKVRDEGGKPCTRAQAQAEAIKVCEHYMAQVPGLVAHMLMEALKAHGFTLQAPVGDAITGAPGGDGAEEDAAPHARGDLAPPSPQVDGSTPA